MHQFLHVRSHMFRCPTLHARASTIVLRVAVPELRQAVARHSEKFNQLPVDWQTETLVTVGATEAIAASFMGILNPGDEVRLERPALQPIGVYEAFVSSSSPRCQAAGGYTSACLISCAATVVYRVCGATLYGFLTTDIAGLSR